MKLESLQAELQKLEARRAKLASQIERESAALYTSLPRKVGLKSVDALINALLPYASSALKTTGKAGTTPGSLSASREVNANEAPSRRGRKASTPEGSSVAKRGRGFKYSPDLKAAVKQELQGGKLKNTEISQKHKIPLMTIKKWKQVWGLTRGKAAKR